MIDFNKMIQTEEYNFLRKNPRLGNRIMLLGLGGSYDYNKIIRLLLECNPNTCEILGLDDDQYLIKSEMGEELIDHSSLLLSKWAIKFFSGYADAQFRRLQNALARDSMSQSDGEKHILKSVQNALEDFNRRYGTYEKEMIRLYIFRLINRRPHKLAVSFV